jgi:hypothetical protein
MTITGAAYILIRYESNFPSGNKTLKLASIKKILRKIFTLLIQRGG